MRIGVESPLNLKSLCTIICDRSHWQIYIMLNTVPSFLLILKTHHVKRPMFYLTDENTTIRVSETLFKGEKRFRLSVIAAWLTPWLNWLLHATFTGSCTFMIHLFERLGKIPPFDWPGLLPASRSRKLKFNRPTAYTRATHPLTPPGFYSFGDLRRKPPIKKFHHFFTVLNVKTRIIGRAMEGYIDRENLLRTAFSIMSGRSGQGQESFNWHDDDVDWPVQGSFSTWSQTVPGWLPCFQV